MKIEILPGAWEDLADGFRFYEKQAPGLGDYFRESMIADIEELQSRGGIHRRVFGHYRMLAKRFPFAAYYWVQNETVVVRAVLDCRRDPVRLRKKLR